MSRSPITDIAAGQRIKFANGDNGRHGAMIVLSTKPSTRHVVVTGMRLRIKDNKQLHSWQVRFPIEATVEVES